MTELEKLVNRFKRGNYQPTAKGCWIWDGTKEHGGYGVIDSMGKRYRAHRIAYAIHKGAIPDGLMILHSCDVRDCVNPAHLRAGTAAENMQDKVDRGRCHSPTWFTGEGNHKAKLTEADVLHIRTRWASEEMMAAHYGVHVATIKDALTRRTWKHLP